MKSGTNAARAHASLRPCVGCGARVPDVEGPTHRYLGASPGCFAVAGEVFEEQYANYAVYAPVHRLAVDAYAAQHTGVPSPQAIKSVGVHLIRLHLTIERGLHHEKANAAMKWASRLKRDFVWLEPPASLGGLTVLHAHAARDPAEHQERVREWARCVWDAWSPHHETIRLWANPAQ
ncbi:MAG: DUF5946 family protein [Rubrobacter sp.]